MIALRILGWIWALPVTLIGVAVAVGFRARPTGIRWRGWHGALCLLEFESSHLVDGYVAITFGAVQVYRPQLGETIRGAVRYHEDVHTLQGMILGAANIPVYGVCSLVSRLRGTGWYTGNALERWARAWERR